MCKLSHICQVSQSLWGNFKFTILFDPFNNPGKSENRDKESKFIEEKTEAFCSYLTCGKSQMSKYADSNSGSLWSWLSLFQVRI